MVMEPRRLKGWEKRYVHGVEDELSRPFDWLNANCGHLMAVAIRACHGQHPILDHLTNITSQEVAEAYFASVGGLKSLLGKHFVEIQKPFAQQADLAVFVGQDGTEIGCIVLDGQVFGRDEKHNHGWRIPVTHSSIAAIYHV